jgi:hypothetical protein
MMIILFLNINFLKKISGNHSFFCRIFLIDFVGFYLHSEARGKDFSGDYFIFHGIMGEFYIIFNIQLFKYPGTIGADGFIAQRQKE